jgi:hypothetical protein
MHTYIHACISPARWDSLPEVGRSHAFLMFLCIYLSIYLSSHTHTHIRSYKYMLYMWFVSHLQDAIRRTTLISEIFVQRASERMRRDVHPADKACNMLQLWVCAGSEHDVLTKGLGDSRDNDDMHVCIYSLVCVCMYLCMYMFMYAYIRIQACILLMAVIWSRSARQARNVDVCVHMYMYIYMYMFICLYAYRHTHVSKHTKTHGSVTGLQKCNQSDVYMYIHTYIYTHISTTYQDSLVGDRLARVQRQRSEIPTILSQRFQESVPNSARSNHD